MLPLESDLLTLDACRTLVALAYRWHVANPHPLLPPNEPFAPPPRVTDGRGRRHACGSRAVIKLPRWSRTRPIVLHECAHGMAADGHGPLFMTAYLRLLARFLDFDTPSLERSLAEAGIRTGRNPPAASSAYEASRLPVISE
ncbi:MAG: hypothetical protein KDE35_11685 [Geminicoccaceae bacterium]|nr:hypothetical protein [Geminicoccaceae bacterium]